MLFKKIKSKHSFYWYIFIPFLITITLFIALSPWLAHLLATPPGRMFTGIHWWSSDYAIYLSYVELGRRGEIGARLLLTTMPQSPVFTQLVYTLSGYLFGKILQFNSVFSYHISRILYGFFFLFSTIFLFYRLSKSKLVTLFAFLFSFYITGFVRVKQIFPLKISRYLAFISGSDIISRAVGPPHYLVGYIIFIATFCWFFCTKHSLFLKTIVFGILLNLILLANPFTYIIMAFSFLNYIVIRLLFSKDKRAFITGELISIIAGFAIALPLLSYYKHFLSREPWGLIASAPQFYQIFHPPIYAKDVLMAFIPLILCGLSGIFGVITKKIKTFLTVSQTAFLLSWILSHVFLLAFGDQIRIDPLRSNQGLYYIPLSLFSAYFILALSKRLQIFGLANYKIKGLAIIILLFVLTLPDYLLSYRNNLFNFTDYKNFTRLVYPTKKSIEAFRWLEANTPVASGVMSMYEASELMQGFSGNSTNAKITEMTRIRFFSNSMLEDEAYKFLKDNNFRYVYFGYQEKYYGGEVVKLPFLRKVFENEEVIIYLINNQFKTSSKI
ncbi:hypothetical protein COV53_03990 [Candidatus Gottesmanbacteria bacterium CG11_big_fil_rev_8_21_14_0_20_37_11]|uniref:Glycosyltransferase RgtA/B/C/D-like domain-containing protein n=3 Tax=Candidatus Gottesmaniibacteriota TaxID=1752720 RepID=A0A2M7RQV6_9BACT|nr:MAG: hypothetical protein AUJ73_00450 [Candidatus Gottesmanbacteria bacterium CG1_02_37_22]PIR08232.1 MAG: hypothetical protein COV53_03990 [Candidatus Gottesmanbacteria bacterium CG11_big_fil_rev_8_21_14_0_20_37_11]PIZ02686.1 MAG: hypothetical protein COY59_03380 [Candidatus Gottesmanbacteria bacterium CG_4_10_14_0_8_um_filter_37_24]